MNRAKTIFIIILAVLAIGLAAGILSVVVGGSTRLTAGGTKNPPLRSAELKVGEAVFSAEIAQTVIERVRGLSGRDGLGGRAGMLFVFGTPGMQTFWMKDMKFPIDIIWIAGNRVIGFAENAQPEPGKSEFELMRYSPPEPADKVFEVQAGAVSRLGIKVGDEVLLSL